MEIQAQHTDQAVLAELGQRLTRQRLERGLTQAELAAQAGVSKRTVERMESGASTQLSSFVRVLRTLGLLQRLNGLLPEPAPSPIELLKLRGKPRKRASRRKSKKGPPDSNPLPDGWTWGEDT